MNPLETWARYMKYGSFFALVAIASFHAASPRSSRRALVTAPALVLPPPLGLHDAGRRAGAVDRGELGEGKEDNRNPDRPEKGLRHVDHRMMRAMLQ